MNNTRLLIIFMALSALGLLMFDHTHFDGITKKDDSNVIDSLINRVYFMTTTVSSVGYGDIVPVSRSLKVYVSIMHVIIVFASLQVVMDIVKE